MTKPIIALDFKDMEAVRIFLKPFNESLFVKVGMELYLQNGPDIIKEIRNQGHEIFLDLKLHDIPNTVGQAMKGLGNLDIQMVNVHAAGGSIMMQRALEGLRDSGSNASLIAVTQLTSTSELMMQQEQNIQSSINDSILNYATLAQKSGLDGVVCSANESAMIREVLGDAFLKVTPGIRTPEDAKGDQVRIATPEFAKLNGATHIVVGRSITQDTNPVAKYHQIKKAWETDVK
ncbi:MULTISPECIES: orotidine-5'-phosphate decarboxylase [Staphylococcaceae]|uniref:Orotidine 5'-phosphate decarboxylase n=1 Tax=Macrococcus psychrotolerans TaxID=3039389 RepID=A0AAT9P994_9STAP|nr:MULTISPECIES: orotidine-5'-phosphate decarboxylase [Macrococcus]MDJ1110810.1 orotidine-5'-phosphate decarboxylase [Macrococcus sp. S115]QYA33641.1 orotidine-5'-phosphate decarboxylase [Macrococcus sp. 19Msa1099]QYA38461.1 orotidine-5'-phosphate decarboxylase [Macrococcus caseolyticus]QYA77168.1 orotidine-5'-phosphate decarboxylase [Macrococcus caseolyticus]